MVFADGFVGLVMLFVWIFCIIDVITTPETECRNLPKLLWIFIVILLIDLGSILWLVAGRNWNRMPSTRSSGAASKYPEYDRPGRYVPANPDDDAEFLASLRARTEEQRKRARESNRESNKDGEADPS